MAEAIRKVTRHDLEAKIVKRCWEDEAFRKEFTADPAGAFTKYLKVPAKDVPKIVVFEETAGSWHIVVPPRPAYASELSEVDLERVAGGTSGALLGAMVESAKSIAGGARAISLGATTALVDVSGIVSGGVLGSGAVASGVLSAAEGSGW
jgi:hypothetical protein